MRVDGPGRKGLRDLETPEPIRPLGGGLWFLLPEPQFFQLQDGRMRLARGSLPWAPRVMGGFR